MKATDISDVTEDPAISASELSHVIGRIYECATAPGRWPEVLRDIGGYIRGNRPRIFLFNANDRHSGIGVSFGVDNEFNRAFDADIATLESIRFGFVVSELDAALTLDEILGVSGGRDVNGRLREENAFYQKWMAPRAAHDALAALIVKTPRRFGGLAMTRSDPLPPFGPEEKLKVRLLAPHIRRALQISDMIDNRTVERDRFGEIIDVLSTPVAIVDPDGRLLHMNEAAQRLIGAGDVLNLEAGVLRPVSNEARADFRAALSRRDQQPTAIALQSSAQSPLLASILPLQSDVHDSPLAVFFHGRDGAFHLPGEAFAKMYRLTGAELRVLLLLLEGGAVAQIAERTGNSAETIRWHIKNLLEKTGCARQTDLVRLAAVSASPIAPDARPAAD